MARYLDVDKISSYIRENFSIDKTKNADICFAFIDFMNWLDDQPTADVEEVKHGDWTKVEVIGNGYGQVYYQHENCTVNSTQLYSSPYEHCPRCGAKMDGKEI